MLATGLGVVTRCEHHPLRALLRHAISSYPSPAASVRWGKWTVGALDFDFKGGDASWAYGDLRTHGGHTASGTSLKHQVVSQGWTVLPAP